MTLDSKPLRFSSMNNNQPYTIHDNVVLLQRLNNAEHELAQVRQKLAEIAARPQPAPVDNSPAGKASRLPVPYSPAGGDETILLVDNRVVNSTPRTTFARAGVEYTTKEAAEASLVRLRQYALLLHLAADLNPSGKAGGPWFVTFRVSNASWEPVVANNFQDGASLFENSDAASEAAKILNRDGVKPAGHNG